MKKAICLFAALLLLCGCAESDPVKEETVFTINAAGNLVSEQGVEYAFLANESVLYYLGDWEFVGRVQGEEETYQHLGLTIQTGMFAIQNAENDNILIRRIPDNEWFAVYRKTALPAFDFTPENCVRLEFVPGNGFCWEDAPHATCGDGITDQAEISAFLSEIRMQDDPRKAGLYDLAKNPDGTLENSYICGAIYGFFEEEPNLVIRMMVTSYNDLAYSVSLDGREYVLPAQWLQKLQR